MKKLEYEMSAIRDKVNIMEEIMKCSGTIEKAKLKRGNFITIY